jgi:hypothetical protein
MRIKNPSSLLLFIERHNDGMEIVHNDLLNSVLMASNGDLHDKDSIHNVESSSTAAIFLNAHFGRNLFSFFFSSVEFTVTGYR